MRACSACTEQATTVVHGHDLCHTHGCDMVTAVLAFGMTPVGFIVKAACGWRPVPTGRVSAPETPAIRSSFMQHGALPALPLPMGTSSISRKPEPLRSHPIAEHRTVKVSKSQWREVNS